MSLSGWSAGLAALVLIGGTQVASAQNKLEPTGPPGPTMKTLDEIPPSWSQVLPAAQRFQLVLGGEAVLDKETGLVWERSPSTSPRDWEQAHLHCNRLIVANRLGWRLPKIQDLTSLFDSSSFGFLPSGHPFANVPFVAWSATTSANSALAAWVTVIADGVVSAGNKNDSTHVWSWCVRGGNGVDSQ